MGDSGIYNVNFVVVVIKPEIILQTLLSVLNNYHTTNKHHLYADKDLSTGLLKRPTNFNKQKFSVDFWKST